MNIGQFRDQITFQYFTRTSDGAGGFTQTWVDDLTVWAKVTPLTTQEGIEAGQSAENNPFRIWIYWTNDFSATFNTQYRIKRGTDVYNIVQIRNIQDGDWFYEILAVQKQK